MSSGLQQVDLLEARYRADARAFAALRRAMAHYRSVLHDPRASFAQKALTCALLVASKLQCRLLVEHMGRVVAAQRCARSADEWVLVDAAVGGTE